MPLTNHREAVSPTRPKPNPPRINGSRAVSRGPQAAGVSHDSGLQKPKFNEKTPRETEKERNGGGDSLFGVMALLRGSHLREAGFFHCCVPYPLGHLSCSLFDGVWSRALFASAHSANDTRACWHCHRHTHQFWRTLAASVDCVSQLHTDIPLLLAGGTLTSCSPFSSPVVHDKLMHLYSHCKADLAVSFPSVSEPLECPTDIILSGSVTVHSGSNCCSLAPL